jgi:predicted GNAT family acetyltransferase
MVQRLLELVAEGGAHSYADLAEGLGVSEGLLGQMIEDLARMGYLRPVYCTESIVPCCSSDRAMAIERNWGSCKWL